jgi:hypothetical protein
MSSSSALLKPQKPSSKARSNRHKRNVGAVPDQYNSVPRPVGINPVTLVPLRTNTTLYIAKLYQLDTNNATALATGGELVINLNSLCIPLPSNNTEQPYGYDQLAAFYARFKVKSVDLEIDVGTYISTGLSHTTCAWFQCRPPTSTATISGINTAFDTLGDRSNADYIILQSSTSAGLRKYRKHIDIAKLAGLSKSEFEGNTDTFAGLMSGTSPTKLATFAIAASSDTIIPVTHNFYIRLAYNVECFDRLDFAQS